MKSTRQWPAQEGLAAELRLRSMTEKLPYEDERLDAVVSVWAIHHAVLEAIPGIADEIGRVLKRRGSLSPPCPD
jgi:ubiquinone/menaquinone biosynthesis C-methylase UbiE